MRYKVLHITITLLLLRCDAFNIQISTRLNRDLINLSERRLRTFAFFRSYDPLENRFLRHRGLTIASEKNIEKSRSGLQFGSKTLLRKRFVLAAVILSFLITFKSVMFRPLSYGIGTLMAPLSWASNMVMILCEIFAAHFSSSSWLSRGRLRGWC